jgi:hypothetical protein
MCIALTLEREIAKLFFHSSQTPLPRRLTARQQTLDLFIEVRILAGQQMMANPLSVLKHGSVHVVQSSCL